MSIQLNKNQNIHHWEPMILALIPDDETTSELLRDFNSGILPSGVDLGRYGRIIAMTAIYINSYLRSEKLPDFEDKPSGKDELDFVGWLSIHHGVPISTAEI